MLGAVSAPSPATETAPQDPWPAPLAGAPVRATVSVPGSKSVTNRALLLAALADGSSVLRRPLRSRDTLLMAAALRAVGVAVADTENGGWTVTGCPGPLPGAGSGVAGVETGLAGTVARFLPAVAALVAGDVHLDGDPRMRERPLNPLVTALRTLGVSIDDGGRGALPLTVRGTGTVTGGEVVVDASGSSQLVSGLLLAAPRFTRGVLVRHVGARLPSAWHLRMTVEMLRAAGAEVDDTVADRWQVHPGALHGLDTEIEPDLSTAAPLLAAALATGGTVKVSGWPVRSCQPGSVLPDLLTAFGATCSHGPDGLTVTGPGTLTGVDLDLSDVGELTPVLVAVAALADGPSTLRGVAHLRMHETDRLAALSRELGALGGDVRETADGLTVHPRPLHGGVFRTYADHRLAQTAAVLGLVVDGVEIEDVATTAKTVPDFTGLWDRMLGRTP